MEWNDAGVTLMEKDLVPKSEKGMFIVMEGPDGSGKTTQIEMLSRCLKERGKECLITREPGGTAIGEQIRAVILNPENQAMSPAAEMLLYAAARAQLMKEVIVPALQAGKVVLSDRFLDSSLVYQGIARGIGIDKVYQVNALGIGDYMPDLVFFLDLPEEEGIRRKKGQKALDRMEQEGIDFHHLVAEGYRKILKDRPDVVRVDALQPEKMIHNKIIEHLRDMWTEETIEQSGPDSRE